MNGTQSDETTAVCDESCGLDSRNANHTFAELLCHMDGGETSPQYANVQVSQSKRTVCLSSRQQLAGVSVIAA